MYLFTTENFESKEAASTDTKKITRKCRIIQNISTEN